MRRELVVGCVLVTAVLGAPSAGAVDGGVRADEARAKAAAADAGANHAPTAHGEEAKAAEGDQATERDPHGGDPHGHGGANTMDRPPEDGAVEDSTLPRGTISVQIADPSGRPMPSTVVTLGILYNSIAKGESRKRVTGTTDEQGRARFDGLDIGTSVAYRVSVNRDGATFAVPPFQLSARSGTKALLHVYPVTSDVDQVMVFAQSIVYAEVKDDRVQVQQALRLFNMSRVAWVPNDVVIALPPEFTAFTSQQGMSDVGVDAVPHKGVKLHGTFGPGQHVVEFRWQLPYAGESEVRFEVGTIPRTVAARVIVPASKDMSIEVTGMPQAQATSDAMGQRVLITEKQINSRDEKPLSSIPVVVRGLPTVGPGRWVATMLALAGLVLGIVVGAKKPAPRDHKNERARLLEELATLERAHAAGDVGPKTYERARRELLDEIARTLSEDKRPAKGAKSGRKRSAAVSS